jgi:ABC-2 type transport system ATP-binding protein
MVISSSYCTSIKLMISWRYRNKNYPDGLEGLLAPGGSTGAMNTQELHRTETSGSPVASGNRSPAPVIEVTHLHKAYGTTIAVDDVSFTVKAGEIFGILGRNGAGKTTTVECITGLRTADRGAIRVLGLDPRRDGQELHERVGVQLQESALPDRMRVSEAVELYASFYRRPADGRELLATLGLTAAKDQCFKQLSGGQRQRLSIVLALIGQPELAVLDELTTGLDPEARRDTWRLIEGVRDRGVTIVLVTHLMEEAERLCDRVALIDHGKVIALGGPAALGEQAATSRRVRFKSPGPLAEDVLWPLPEVSAVEHHGEDIVVSGSGDLLAAVVLALHGAGLRAEDLRPETASLEDAFLALTDETTDTATNQEMRR